MTHIRDKTIVDLISDFKTLKLSELWAVILGVTTVIGGIFSTGVYIGEVRAEKNLNVCNVKLERRTELLHDVAYANCASWDIENKIKQELNTP
jgi:hypothetical protein